MLRKSLRLHFDSSLKNVHVEQFMLTLKYCLFICTNTIFLFAINLFSLATVNDLNQLILD